jgi:trehalose 6-phosphate synthase/phosphatase
VNPYNSSRVAKVLAEALESDSPNTEAFQHMTNFVNENTSMRWANRFLDQLEAVGGDPRHESSLFRASEKKTHARLAKAKRPLVFLDYDGTLRSYVINPKEAVPDERILSVLRKLSQVATVYVVSGRDGATLERWLGHLPIGLVCEHGLAIRPPQGQWEQRTNVSGSALTRLVQPVFEDFVRRTPGSAIENKRAAIAWHYRAADPEYSAFQAREMLTRLEDLLKRRPYKVLRGSRVIEVRHENVTKGNAVAHLLDRHTDADFLFCAGDDRTDEDMMRAIPSAWQDRTITCWVGSKNPWAAYWKESNTSLLTELELMERLWRRSSATGKAGANGQKARPAAPRRGSPKTPTSSTTAKKKGSSKASQRSRSGKAGSSKRAG